MEISSIFQGSKDQRDFDLSERSRYVKCSKFSKFSKKFQEKGQKWVCTPKMQKFRPSSRNLGRKIEKTFFSSKIQKSRKTCFKSFWVFKTSFFGFYKAFRTFFIPIEHFQALYFRSYNPWILTIFAISQKNLFREKTSKKRDFYHFSIFPIVLWLSFYRISKVWKML